MGSSTNSFLAGEIGQFLNYPLFKMGDSAFTLFSALSIVFWLALILTLDFLARRFVVQRVLKRTRLDTSSTRSPKSADTFLFHWGFS